MKFSPVCRTIQINGKQHYLWRAVDQDGEVVDVFLQAQRFATAHAAVQNLFNFGLHLVSANHFEISGCLRSQNGVVRLPETGWQIPAVWMS